MGQSTCNARELVEDYGSVEDCGSVEVEIDVKMSRMGSWIGCENVKNGELDWTPVVRRKEEEC